MSAWLSETPVWLNQGSSGFGSVSPAATRFLYSSVFFQMRFVRPMFWQFFASVSAGLPAMVESL